MGCSMQTQHDVRLALQGVGMFDGLAADRVDDHLARYRRLHDIGHRGMAFYLLEVQERGLHQVFGYESTVEYAQHRHDLDERRTRELLHAGARLRELVLIDEAFCRHEISWSKVILLLRVANEEHEEAWLERARESGVGALKHDVRLARRGGPPRDPDDVKGLPEVRFPVRASLGVHSHELLETAQKKLGAERGRPATVEDVLELTMGIYLDLERTGKTPGWTHVPSSHFRIHLQAAGPEPDAPLLVQTDDGLYPLDADTAHGAVSSQRGACARCDGEHILDDDDEHENENDTENGHDHEHEHGPEHVRERKRDHQPGLEHPHDRVHGQAHGHAHGHAHGQAHGHAHGDAHGRAQGHGHGQGLDQPTPPALRRRVLARDRHRCRCCGRATQLHVHHIVLRSHGGRTKVYNLVTLCIRCHALVHAGLLVIEGTTTKKARFVDRNGHPIVRPDRTVDEARLLAIEAPPRRDPIGLQAAPGGTPSVEAEPRSVALADVPDTVDGDWWRRHARLIRSRPDRGLELWPGVPLDDASPPTNGASSFAERTSAAEGTSVVEGTSAVEGASAADGTPVAGGASSAEETSAAEGTSVVEETSAAEGGSVAEETSAPEGASAVEGTSAAERTSTVEGTSAADGASVVGGASSADPAAPVAVTSPESFDVAFAGLVGRDDVLARLRTERDGSRALGEPFPHTLLTGAPGTGKTTLAAGLAACSSGHLVRTNGPLLQDTASLLRLLASLAEGDILFLDEVHAVPAPVLELLYQAMSERRLALTLHEGGRGRAQGLEKAITLALPPFTVLAATTVPSELDRAFVSRFGVREHLEPLDDAALASLATARARARRFELTAEAGDRLAAHARGTPRELLRLLDRALHHAAARGRCLLDQAYVDRVLAQLGYDEQGLSRTERRCVALLRGCRDPIPASRLARLLGVDRRTLTEEVEPWLVRQGHIRITPRGRSPAPPRWAAADGAVPHLLGSAGRRKSAVGLAATPTLEGRPG